MSDPYEIEEAKAIIRSLRLQLGRDQAEVARLTRELKRAEQRAEYWKAEHLAGNAEIDRLTRELAEAQKHRDGFQRGVQETLFALTGEFDLSSAMKHLAPDLTIDVFAKRVVAERDTAREALRQVEWVPGEDGWHRCPWCNANGERDDPVHHPTCARQAALGPAEPTS